MLKKPIIWPVFLYSLLLMGLGAYGYYETGSKISLGTSLGFGFLLIICTLFMCAGKKIGAYFATPLIALLTGVFAYRYAMTKGLIPAILAVVSAGLLIYLLVRIRKLD